MRKLQYSSCLALALFASLGSGPLPACEPPAGFINPPRPEIAPLEGLLSHTEQKVVAGSLADSLKSASRPLEEAIRPTKDLPGVSGTFRLSSGPFGTVGARRLVCLTDGNIAVEEVLLTESNSDGNRFRYVVWNYTHPKFRDVSYAVGEFIRTQPTPDRTHVTWTYRFALKDGVGAEERSRFQENFLEQQFADWMRNVFGTAKSATAVSGS
jgi:hypothetical protein